MLDFFDAGKEDFNSIMEAGLSAAGEAAGQTFLRRIKTYGASDFCEWLSRLTLFTSALSPPPALWRIQAVEGF